MYNNLAALLDIPSTLVISNSVFVHWTAAGEPGIAGAEDHSGPRGTWYMCNDQETQLERSDSISKVQWSDRWVGFTDTYC